MKSKQLNLYNVCRMGFYAIKILKINWTTIPQVEEINSFLIFLLGWKNCTALNDLATLFFFPLSCLIRCITRGRKNRKLRSVLQAHTTCLYVCVCLLWGGGFKRIYLPSAACLSLPLLVLVIFMPFGSHSSLYFWVHLLGRIWHVGFSQERLGCMLSVLGRPGSNKMSLSSCGDGGRALQSVY